MKKRIFFILVLVLIIGAGIYTGVQWGIHEYKIRQISGKLTLVSPLAENGSHYTMGKFTLTLDPQKGGRFVVTHADTGTKELWATIPGQSFLSSGSATDQVSEARGNFFIDETVSSTCFDQAVTKIVQDHESVVINGSVDCGSGDTRPYTIIFHAVSSNQLGFDIQLQDQKSNQIFLTYSSSSDEHFFGFGEQYSSFDMKGKRLPIFISEQGVGRGEQPITFLANLTNKAGGDWWTTYAAAPYYITSQSRSLFLENSEYSVFDLRQNDRVQVVLWSGHMVGRIIAGSTPAELITEYTGYAGRMRRLPDWILGGAVVGMQGGTDKVREVWQKLEKLGTPISAFWLQDWVGQRSTSFGKQLWWNWELDEQRYPGWNGLQKDLANQQIRMMVYISPFLADVSNKPGVKRNLFKEAASQGYLVKDATGQPYMIQNTDFSAGLLDLTNPSARDWMKQVIRDQVLAIGASGWMADFGEALPYDAVLANGDAHSFHNLYPVEWARLNREVLDGLNDGNQKVFFTRSGFTQSPMVSTLFWEGDQLTTWDANDGIKSAVTGLLSSGVSGIAYNHSDIGGYTAVITRPIIDIHRDKELLMRWMELSAFTTVYRTHEGNRPDDNAQFYSDDESLAQFDRMAKVYKSWEFYRMQLVTEAAETGMPVVRHPWLEYPDDPVFLGMSSQQFMVGTEIMVAPVEDPGIKELSVYLPVGRWVHIWSGKTYALTQGEWVKVATPMGEPAVFYKEGSPIGDQFKANLRAYGLLK